MSFELTKYRAASHDRVAVGGSYTDTWLEVEGATSTSTNSAAVVNWVPNNKSGSGYLNSNRISTAAFSNNGYLT